ncbi:secretion system protein, partial [Acidithiobacillus ferridurans]|nr:secretion system protein [Acidithiobacillus ferridurans]
MVDQNILGILVFAAVAGFVLVALEATRQALVKGRATFARDGQVRLS